VEKGTYTVKRFDLKGLNGISDKTLEMHFKLYEGYVHETNVLNAALQDLISQATLNQEQKAVFAELNRRLGFEYNGMVLHELYFENLKSGGTPEPDAKSAFKKSAIECFASFEKWKNDFVNVGEIRGVGWAICYADQLSGRISNHWINEHEVGHVAGFKPLVVMDVWEHAFLLDYKPADRPKYIDAFLSNLDWKVVEGRLAESLSAKAASVKRT